MTVVKSFSATAAALILCAGTAARLEALGFGATVMINDLVARLDK